MNALDTNIWIYCYDQRDSQKQQTAQRVVETADPLALLWQVGCEFISAARKLEPLGFAQSDAWQALTDMEAMADNVLLPEPAIRPHCRAIQDRHGMHFWDALIVAACIQGGVITLHSEDLGHYGEIEGLKIVNPFRS